MAYTHKPDAQYDGQHWRPVILRGEQIARTSGAMYDNSYEAREHAKDWLVNRRRQGEFYP